MHQMAENFLEGNHKTHRDACFACYDIVMDMVVKPEGPPSLFQFRFKLLFEFLETPAVSNTKVVKSKIELTMLRLKQRYWRRVYESMLELGKKMLKLQFPP